MFSADKKMQKRKRRLRSSTGQRKQLENNKRIRSYISSTENERIAAELKADFEAEKEKIINSIDNSYKELFGKIAFCRSKKDPFRPVLILSPYSVPPSLRENWLTMFKTVSELTLFIFRLYINTLP